MHCMLSILFLALYKINKATDKEMCSNIYFLNRKMLYGLAILWKLPPRKYFQEMTFFQLHELLLYEMRNDRLDLLLSYLKPLLQGKC